MNLIVAVDTNWAIGMKNELLVKIPEDQKWFREMTTNKVIIMGRKTLESFPNKMPLKNRVNIVITKDMNYKVKDAIVVHSIEEALEQSKKYQEEDVYVIGGESIYKQMLPYCNIAHVTKIDYEYDADTFFPNLDKDPEWKASEVSDERTYFSLIYEFIKYERR